MRTMAKITGWLIFLSVLGVCCWYAAIAGAEDGKAIRAAAESDIPELPVIVPTDVLPFGVIPEIPVRLTIAERKAIIARPYQSLTIAVCNPHAVFDVYKKPKDAQVALDAETKAGQAFVQAQIDTQIGIINAKTAELKKAKKKNREAIEDEIDKLNTSLQKFVKTYRLGISAKRQSIAAGGYADIYAAIAKIAKERGINLVLNSDTPKLKTRTINELLPRLYYRQSVLYSDETLDITDAVIKVLNKEISGG